MPLHKYLLPLISVCPPPGYRLIQSVDLDLVGELLDRPDAEVSIMRRVIMGERDLVDETELLRFENRRCPSAAFRFEFKAPIDDHWLEGSPLAYLETHLRIEGEGYFQSQFGPDFYTIYGGPTRKSFFSDNALKYGNTVNIFQIQAFGAWVEGYPTCLVDQTCDIDESLLLINPFLRPAVVDVTLEGIADKRRFRINAQTGRRISLAEAFEIGATGWAGQVYVSGRSRIVMYVLKHSLADPSTVTTLEHSNPYRGEPTHLPMTQTLRSKIGMALRSAR